MPDEVSTLALRVSSGDAIQNLRAVAHESEALGGITDQLKGKILSVVSAYASWHFGKDLLANAVQGEHAAMRFGRVFKSIADDAEKAVQTLSKNYLFDDAGVRQSLSLITDKLKMTGLDLKQSLNISTELHKAAADFTAYSKEAGGTEEILRGMQMAITGNTRALMQYGIIIDDNAVKMEKAAQKARGMFFANDKAATAQARLTVLQRTIGMATGTLAENMDSYANRLRRFEARLGDLKGNLGDAFLPVASKVVDVMANIVSVLNDTSPAMKTVMVTAGAMTGVLLAVGPTVLKVATGFKTFTAAKALETLATQKETAATTAETGALVAQNAVASSTLAQTEALTVAKTAEAAARTRNAQAMAAENLAGTSKPFQRIGMDGMMNFGTKAPSAKTGKLLSESSKELGKFNSGLSGILTTFGSKLGVVKNFASGVMRVFGVFGKAPGYVALVVGSLEVLKHAPQWIEVAFDKLPGVFASLGEKSIAALKNLGSSTVNWGKDLVVGGLLGAAQTGKRLLGMETEASREYKLNKQIEENNKKREELQKQEAKQRAAENAVLTAQNAAAQSKVNAQLEINNSKESESVKLAKAIELRNQKAYEISHVRNPYDENDEGGKEQQLAALQSQLASGNLTNEQREEITEKAKQLSEEISTLRDEWKEATLEIEKLSESAENAAKAFDENQKAYEKQKLSASEGIADANAQRMLESANSHQSRQLALQKQLDKARAKADESVNAQEKADALNEQAVEIQGQLTNDKVAQALATLGTLAKTGDLSEGAGLKYANAKVMLRDAGYGDIVDNNEGFGQGSALQFLEAMTKRQREQQKELDSILKDRDEKQELANEAGSRLSSYYQAQRSVDDESKKFNEQQENEKRQNEENERRKARANRSFQNSIDETYFNRQLQASDQFYAKDALGAAQSRYNLIGQRGASEWADSMSALKEQQDRLNELNTSLDELNKKFKEGTLTDDETKERERLMAQRTSLEEELNSDYQAAVQKRLQTEDTLLGLEKTMREEYLKNVQNYVNEEGTALRERLQAEAEFEKKRMEELSKVQEEARQAVSGQRGIAAGSSEAFSIASKIYDRGRENLPTEKKIENSTKKIEEYVKIMQESMMAYFTEQSSGMTLAFGY